MIDATPLPGWTLAKLSDITRKVGSGSTPRGGSDAYHSTGTPLIRSQNVRFEGFTDEGLVLLDDAQVDALRDARVQGSDVLLNITGASIGRVCQVPHRLEGACVNQHVCIIRPITQALSPEFLSAFLASPAMQEMIWTEQYGVTRQALTKGQILDFDVPLPPLAEQRRIVAKVEELLGKVSACRQRLVKIPTILKRFRQSVLAAACSGRLTADWRAVNSVSDAWEFAPLSELFVMRSGKSLTVNKRQDGSIPVYGGNGPMGFHNESNTSGSVIVVGRVGAQCGNVHFHEGHLWVTDNAISLQAKAKLSAQFYAKFLTSQNLNTLSGGTGQPYVSQEILNPLSAPLVSLDEQKEIVGRVDELMRLADQLEARFRKADAHVKKLTQAILAKAFRGELVPTEHELAAREGRDYESAEQLLARLRAERSTAEPTKPTRRPRNAKPAAKDD